MITNKIPLVSVVMSCYNSEKFIADAIKTVANQTYRNWELIIVNDFSTDNSMRIVKKSIERFGISKKVKIINHEKNIFSFSSLSPCQHDKRTNWN